MICLYEICWNCWNENYLIIERFCLLVVQNAPKMYLVKTKGGNDKPSKPSVATHSGYQDQDQETHSLEVWAGPAKPGSRRNTDPDFLKGFDEESSEEHQGNVNPTDGYVDCGNHWAPSCMQCGLYKYDCLGDCYWNSAGHCNDHYEEPVVTPLLGWWIHGYQLQITIDKIILIIIWLALKVLVCGIEKPYFYPHWRFRTLAHLSRQSSSARSVSLVLTCHFEHLCLKTTFARVSTISTYILSRTGHDLVTCHSSPALWSTSRPLLSGHWTHSWRWKPAGNMSISG